MSLRNAAVTQAVIKNQVDATEEQKRLATQLTNLIPAEAIAGFVALIAATENYSYRTRVWMFWIVLVLTPLYVIGNYMLAATGAALTNPKKWPWFTAFLGIVAFVAWALTVPKSPFHEHLLFVSDKGVSPQTGAVIMVATSMVLGALTTLALPALRRFIEARKKQGSAPDPPAGD